MTKEKQDKLINTGIVIGIAVLIILLIIGVFEYWPKDENPTEYHETVTTASVTTNDKTDETSKPADTTKKDETTSDVGTSGVADTTNDVAVVTTNEAIVTTQGLDSSTEISTKNESTTESVTTGGDSSYSNITTSSPETTVSVTTAPEITTKPETTKSPEVTTKKPTTTAKPTTTKTPVTTKSPEVTTKSPTVTTQYPMETILPPEELTGNYQTINDVLVAPNGDLVHGYWKQDSSGQYFIVDLPVLSLWEQYRWWHYDASYRILEYGIYTCVSNTGRCVFQPDIVLPPVGSGGVTGSPEGTIGPGTWW